MRAYQEVDGEQGGQHADVEVDTWGAPSASSYSASLHGARCAEEMQATLQGDELAGDGWGAGARGEGGHGVMGGGRVETLTQVGLTVMNEELDTPLEDSLFGGSQCGLRVRDC
jgi:hypothetical protein